MHHVLDRTAQVNGFAAALDECVRRFSPRALMVLSCDGNGFTPESIDPVLQNVPLPLFGGIFPGILCEQELLLEGTLVVALPVVPKVEVIHGISGAAPDFDNKLPQGLVQGQGQTMFVFVDGLADAVGPLMTSLFCTYGLEVNYIGGGAGALRAESTPCLMTNSGLVRDAAVFAVLDLASGVGICHGLESVSGPHRVSAVRKNRIGQLDGVPAKERFLELIHAVDPTLADKTGFPVSDRFCLAVTRLGGEKVIRDPYMADPDGSLHVVCEPGEGSFVHVMQATPEATIDAAAQALQLAHSSYQSAQPPANTFCFDCFGRWNLLGDRFGEELAMLQDKRAPLLGALTVGGEIANCGTDFLDYYNRTCVVGVL